VTYTIIAIVALWIGGTVGFLSAACLIAGRRADEKLPSAEIIRLVDLRAARERSNVGAI